MESTVDHWDRLWDQHKDEPIHKTQLRHLVAHYEQLTGDLMKDATVLEAGAGSAIDSITLKQMTDCDIVCVDYSPKSITFIRKNFRKYKVKGKAVKADIRKLPFKAGAFDAIFSNGVLEHFRHPITILKEQRRVLRPGGLLVVGVPETYSLYTLKKHLLMRLGKWFAGWETQYTARQMRRMAREAGLRVIETRVYGNPPLTAPKFVQFFTGAFGLNRIIASDVVLYATRD